MKKQLLLACLVSTFTLPAMADSFYVLGDVGRGKAEVGGNDGYSYNKTSTAYSVGAGYNINSFFAVELAYRDFGNVSDRNGYVDEGVTYTYHDKIGLTAVQASVVGSLPISEEFSVFGRAGVSRLDMDYDSFEIGSDGSDWSTSGSMSKTKGFLGVGASYKIAPQVALRAEYNQYAKWDGLKASSLTVGATYSF